MSASARALTTGTVQWRSWHRFEQESEARGLARFVRSGGVVVFPTESSYALGADPENADGVATVYRIKKRPGDKPLPVVVASIDYFKQLGIHCGSGGFSGLAKAWPGPLTVVVPSERALPAACGRKELAVRVPGHRRLRRLLERAGVALTATSANLAGDEPLLELGQLAKLVAGERVLVIDEGPLDGGAPSTLVRWEGDSATVLRWGALNLEGLRRVAPGLRFKQGFSAGAVEIPVEEGA
ncbi:MAG: threonylcarbamoyl-AMP synthase [bacterium]|nr:threonylcarbamoyl-AMP synthase [bacterium]